MRYDIAINLQNNTTRGMRSIERGLTRLNSRANRVTASLGKVAGAAISIGGAVAIRGIVNQYLEFEKYNTVLTTFLGSQSAATDELDRLRNLANTLPQDLNDITQAFTILTRNGIDTASGSLTAFSNIATANAKTFTQLAEAVADGLTGEFERFKEFGVKVSKENDKFVVRLGEQILGVADTAGAAVGIIKTLGEEGGRFSSAAENNANTLGQALSNLRGIVNQASISFAEGFIPQLQLAATSLANFVANNGARIKQWGVNVGQALNDAGRAFLFVVDNIDTIIIAIKSLVVLRLAGWAATAGAAVAALAATVGIALGPLGLLFALVAGGAAAFILFKDNADPVKEALDDAKVAQDAFNAALGTFTTTGAVGAGKAAIELARSYRETAAAALDAAQAEVDAANARVAGSRSFSGGRFGRGQEQGAADAGQTAALADLAEAQRIVTNARNRELFAVRQVTGATFENGVVVNTSKEAVDALAESLAGLSLTLPELATATGAAAEVIDPAVQALLDKFVEAERLKQQALEATQAKMRGFFDNLIVDGKINFDKLTDIAIEAFAKIAAQALFLNSNIGGILGNLFGGVGGTASVLGSIFGGFFADGGNLAAGKFGVVGENGPELITGPATVYSNSDSRGMLGGGASGAGPVVFNTTLQVSGSETQDPAAAKRFADQFNKAVEAKVSSTIAKMQNGRGMQASGTSY